MQMRASAHTEKLRSSWQDLQRDARSLTDVSHWFVQHGRQLLKAAYQLAATTGAIDSQVVKVVSGTIRTMLLSRTELQLADLLSPELTVVAQLHVPERHYLAPLLRELGGVVIASSNQYGVTRLGCNRCMSLRFDARQWPFIGAALLHRHVELPLYQPYTQRLDTMRSILAAHFPGITLAEFDASAKNLLVVADKSMFYTWLYQFSAEAITSAAMALPEDVTQGMSL